MAAVSIVSSATRLGLVASSHRTYRKPMLRDRRLQLSFVPIHAALERILQNESLGTHPSQISCLWNRPTADGSAWVLVTSTCIYRIPVHHAVLGPSSSVTTVAVEGSPANRPLCENDDSVSCMPLEFIERLSVCDVSYGIHLSDGSSVGSGSSTGVPCCIVQLNSKAIPSSSATVANITTPTNLATAIADSTAATAAVNLLWRALLPRNHAMELKSLLATICPVTALYANDAIEAQRATRVLSSEPKSVVYPLCTLYDVAQRDAIDESVEHLADRIHLMSDAFGLAATADTSGAGPSSAQGGPSSSPSATAPTGLDLASCSHERFLYVLSSAKEKVLLGGAGSSSSSTNSSSATTSATSASAADWIRWKERLLSHMRALDDEVAYLHTQAEVLGRMHVVDAHAAVTTSPQRTTFRGPGGEATNAVSAVHRLLQDLSGSASAKSGVEDLVADLQERHATMAAHLASLEAEGEAAVQLPSASVVNKQLIALQATTARLEAELISVFDKPLTVRSLASVRETCHSVGMLVSGLLSLSAAATQLQSNRSSGTSSNRALQTAVEECAKLVDQYRAAELELSTQADSLKVQLLTVQNDMSVRVRYFVRWLFLHGRRKRSPTSRDVTLQQALDEERNASQLAQRLLREKHQQEVIALQGQVSTLQQRATEREAQVNIDRAAQQHHFEDERQHLVQRITVLEQQRASLQEHNAVLEEQLEKRTQSLRSLEASMSDAERGQVAAIEAATRRLQEDHAKDTTAARSTIRDLQARLRDAEATLHSEIAKWEDRLSAERTEQAARKKAELAAAVAALEEDLHTADQRALTAQRLRDQALGQLAAVQVELQAAQQEVTSTRQRMQSRERELNAAHAREMEVLQTTTLEDKQAAAAEHARLKRHADEAAATASEALLAAKEQQLRMRVEYEARSRELEHQLAAAQKESQASLTALRAAESEKSDVERELIVAKRQASDFRSEVDTLRTQTLLLQEQVDHGKEERAALERLLSKAEENSTTSAKGMTADLDRLSAIHAAATRRLADQLNAVTAELVAAKEALAESNRESAQLRDDAHRKQQECAAALEMVQDLEEELRSVHEERLRLDLALTESRREAATQSAALQRQLDQAREAASRSEHERMMLIAQHEEAVQVLSTVQQKKVDTLTAQVRALESDVEARNEHLRQHRAELQEITAQLRHEQTELQECHGRELQLRRQLSRREQELVEMQNEHKARLDLQDNTLSTACDEARSLESQVQAMHVQRETLKFQLSRSEEELQRLQKLVEALKSSASMREQELVKAAEADRSRLRALHEHELTDARGEALRATQQAEVHQQRAAQAVLEGKTRVEALERQIQKLSQELAEQKAHTKRAQAEFVSQTEVLRDLEREVAGVQETVREEIRKQQELVQVLHRTEVERDEAREECRRVQSVSVAADTRNKQELQQLQTALLTLSMESEARERDLTLSIERMAATENAQRATERAVLEKRVAEQQGTIVSLSAERDALAAATAALRRELADLKALSSDEGAQLQRLRQKQEEQEKLLSQLDKAMQLAADLERAMSLQLAKEQALTKSLNESAQRQVELHEENRSLLILLENAKQEAAAMMLESDRSLSTVRSERAKLLTVHDDELRLERDRVRQLERERDALIVERRELQSSFDDKLQRTYETHKARVAELVASWDAQKDQWANERHQENDAQRARLADAQRQVETSEIAVIAVRQQLDLRDQRIVELQAALAEKERTILLQEKTAAERLSAALEMLSDVEYEASVHEQSVVASAEETANLRMQLQVVGGLEERLAEVRRESQHHLTRAYNLEEQLQDKEGQIQRSTLAVEHLKRDVASLTTQTEELQQLADRRAATIAQQTAAYNQLLEGHQKLAAEFEVMSTTRAEAQAMFDAKTARFGAERQAMICAHEMEVSQLKESLRRSELREAAHRNESEAFLRQLDDDAAVISALRSEADSSARELSKLLQALREKDLDLKSAHEELAKIDFLPGRGTVGADRPSAADTVKLLATDMRQLLDDRRNFLLREELLMQQLRDVQDTSRTAHDQDLTMCLDVIANLESEVSALQSQRSELQGTLAASQHREVQLDEAVRALTEEATDLRRKVEELQRLNDDLEQEAEVAIEESQKVAQKLNELDTALNTVNHIHDERHEETARSTQEVFAALESQMERMIEIAKESEKKHQDELLECQNQLDCAEAVFQGLNLSLTDKTARLEIALKRIDELKEEHVQELKRVRERYTLHLAAPEASTATKSTQSDGEPMWSADCSVLSRSGGKPSHAPQAAASAPRELVLPSPEIAPRDAFATKTPTTAPSVSLNRRRSPDAMATTITTISTVSQAQPQVAPPPPDTALIREQVEKEVATLRQENSILVTQLDECRVGLAAATEHAAATGAELTLTKLRAEELEYDLCISQQDLSRANTAHKQALADLAASHQRHFALAVDDSAIEYKKLMARVVQLEDEVRQALFEKTQCKEKLQEVIGEMGNAVALIHETEHEGHLREVALRLEIAEVTNRLKGKESELEVAQSLIAHIKNVHLEELDVLRTRVRHLQEALQASHAEHQGRTAQLDSANKSIDTVVAEMKALADDHGRALEEIAHLKEVVVVVDQLREELAAEQALRSTIASDRNELFRCVAEAAQASGLLAEERDQLAKDLNAILCRPTSARGTQTGEDGTQWWATVGTQCDEVDVVHRGIQNCAVTAPVSTATVAVVLRDVGVQDVMNGPDAARGLGLRVHASTCTSNDGVGQGIWATSATQTISTVVVSTITQAAVEMRTAGSETEQAAVRLTREAFASTEPVAAAEEIPRSVSDRSVGTLCVALLDQVVQTVAPPLPVAPPLFSGIHAECQTPSRSELSETATQDKSTQWSAVEEEPTTAIDAQTLAGQGRPPPPISFREGNVSSTPLTFATSSMLAHDAMLPTKEASMGASEDQHDADRSASSITPPHEVIATVAAPDRDHSDALRSAPPPAATPLAQQPEALHSVSLVDGPFAHAPIPVSRITATSTESQQQPNACSPPLLNMNSAVPFANIERQEARTITSDQADSRAPHDTVVQHLPALPLAQPPSSGTGPAASAPSPSFPSELAPSHAVPESAEATTHAQCHVPTPSRVAEPRLSIEKVVGVTAVGPVTVSPLESEHRPMPSPVPNLVDDTNDGATPPTAVSSDNSNSAAAATTAAAVAVTERVPPLPSTASTPISIVVTGDSSVPGVFQSPLALRSLSGGMHLAFSPSSPRPPSPRTALAFAAEQKARLLWTKRWQDLAADECMARFACEEHEENVRDDILVTQAADKQRMFLTSATAVTSVPAVTPWFVDEPHMPCRQQTATGLPAMVAHTPHERPEPAEAVLSASHPATLPLMSPIRSESSSERALHPLDVTPNPAALSDETSFDQLPKQDDTAVQLRSVVGSTRSEVTANSPTENASSSPQEGQPSAIRVIEPLYHLHEQPRQQELHVHYVDDGTPKDHEAEDDDERDLYEEADALPETSRGLADSHVEESLLAEAEDAANIVASGPAYFFVESAHHHHHHHQHHSAAQHSPTSMSGPSLSALANPALPPVDALDDYDLCVEFANAMELLEEDEFLERSDLLQTFDGELYHLLEREEMRRVEAEQLRQFARSSASTAAAARPTSPTTAAPTNLPTTWSSSARPVVDEGWSAQLSTSFTSPHEVAASPAMGPNTGSAAPARLEVALSDEQGNLSLQRPHGAAPRPPGPMVAHAAPSAPLTSSGTTSPTTPAGVLGTSPHSTATPQSTQRSSSLNYVPPTAAASTAAQPLRKPASTYVSPLSAYLAPGGSKKPTRAQAAVPASLPQRTTAPAIHQPSAPVSAERVAEMLRTMTSEREETLEAHTRIQNIASLMSRSRARRR